MVPLRIFFSSPGDVGEERLLAQRVVDRLRVEFATHGVVEPIFWEHEPLRATASFQEQIPRPSEADIVVFILWSRLGTRLPAHIRKADGTPYSSGTEFEFEDAVESCRRRGVPDLIVYRKAAEPFAPLDRTVIDRLAQKEALDAFIEKWFRGADGSFTAAFHTFETAGQFENLLDTHLRKLIHDRLPRHAGPQVAPPVWTKGSPFCGLEAFTFDKSPVFFGRTQAVSDVLNALRKQANAGRPFVLIMGMSGVGKSSLARAGVLPGLTRPGVIEGIGLWRWAVMRPSDGANLFETLAAALVSEHALPALIEDGTTVSDLTRLLRESPNAVPALVRAHLHQAAEDARRLEHLDAAPAARLVLLVDQLEELFTHPRHTGAERSQWIAAISSLAHSGLVWVLATMRSDFYPWCAELPDLVALKEGAGQYDLLPPSAHEVSQMIRYPARLAGVAFEENAETGERLDDILRDAAVKDSQALPLLEFTLDELYRRTGSGTLTLSAYRALGGVEGALGKRAEEEFARLEPDVQSALPAVVGALVTVGLGDTSPVTRRRTSIAAVTPTASAGALVDALVDARLLIADRADDGTAVVQLAHDSLLRYWPRVRDWIQDSLDALKLRSRIRTAAALWAASGESQAYLLPDDSTLAVAARYLESNRADLDEHEAPFIEISIKAAGRRRRRKLLNRALATAAVLTLATAGVWYWDAYYRVHVNFYATFVYQWLKPVGVQSLTARQVSGRPVSVRFTRTHGRRGQVDRIEHVDRDGHCTAPGVLVTSETFMGIDSTKLEDIFSQEEDADDEPCRLEYRWKADGSVDLVQGFSPQDRHLYTLQFVSPSMAYFTDEHGLAKARFTTGAAYINFTLHADGPQAGFIQGVRYLDAAGKPQADAQGGYGVTCALDPNGLPARCTMLGEHGLPAALPTGVSSLGIGLTPGFFVRAVEIFDLAGSLAELKGIGARLAIEYDDRNNVRRAAAVDRSGEPYLTGWGFSAVSMTYDGQNRLTEARIYGEGGAPGIPDGTFIRRMSYDSEGRLAETSTLGSDEHFISGTEGYAIARFVHDDRAHRSEDLYFGADQHPIAPPLLGYHRGVTRSDDAGRPVEVAFFGADGRPVVAQAGCAVFKTSYDGKGRDLRSECFGPDGKPMLMAGEGWAVKEVVYRDGAEPEARYFDADRKPIHLEAASTAEQFFVVTEIEPGSEAYRVGLKPGDVLRSYNRHEITTADAFIRDISAPGTSDRELRIERDGKPITIDVKPGRLGVQFVQGNADQLKEWGARPR